MKIIGNVLWIIFGGLILAILWTIASLICFISIIGIPVGVQCLKFASFVLYPFGRTIEWSEHLGHFLLNILWVAVCGWELAISSIFIGLIWCITIIGIPFGVQSFKFAQLAIMPFGAKIIPA